MCVPSLASTGLLQIRGVLGVRVGRGPNRVGLWRRGIARHPAPEPGTIPASHTATPTAPIPAIEQKPSVDPPRHEK